MTVQETLKNAREAMDKTTVFFQNQLAKVRTGRASASILDDVKADFYGTLTPISQMATVTAPDARTIMIQPWDRSTLQIIEKAIMQVDLGFNPQNDGNLIRIPVPPLTEDRRKEYIKLCKKFAEESKITLRKIRRDQLDELRKAEKAKEISEDEKKKGEDEIQKLIDEFVKKTNDILSAKEKELLDV